MCGITGFYSINNPVGCSGFYNAHKLIRHRGPDDEGFYAEDKGIYKLFKGDDTIDHFESLEHIEKLASSRLVFGHRRLSIIDLSYHGHQPFVDESQNYILTFNGEIFNYIELRDELKSAGMQFETQTDTEVVLKAYMHWGVDCFNRFNGMWALAIFDRKKNAFVLSRDRFGIKPLYFSNKDGVICFASEQKFLKSFLKEAFKVNKEVMINFLDRAWTNYSDQTFWEQISELEPAHFMIIEDGNVNIKKYWNFQPQHQSRSYKNALEEFEFLFNDSVKLRMRSDVEVGSLLSGGLDSSLITSSILDQKLNQQFDFQTFSSVFNDEKYSEKKYIELLEKKWPLKQHYIYSDPDPDGACFEKVRFHIEDPLSTYALYSQFKVYERIKKASNVKVVINGQGSDELFGGYDRHYFLLFTDLLKHFKFYRFLKESKIYNKARAIPHQMIMRTVLKNLIKEASISGDFNKDTFQELSFVHLRSYLKNDDRNSMAFSIEARVPFLDYRLVEFAFSLNRKFKIFNGANKFIVRKYAEDLLPREILDRKDKMGFVAPELGWLKNQLADLVNRNFAAIKKEGLFDFVDNDQIIGNFDAFLNEKFNDWRYIKRVLAAYQWKKASEATY